MLFIKVYIINNINNKHVNNKNEKLVVTYTDIFVSRPSALLQKRGVKRLLHSMYLK